MASGKLAYFFEAHDLGHVFADWPEEIGLVLCLDAAGLCELLLFHGDERAEMPGKAAAVLGCGAAELEVVPQIEGYATRRVLFTDEQKLMALILDEEDLPELAQDYLINYRFESSRKPATPGPVEAAPVSAPVPDAEAQEAPRPRFRAKPKASAFTEVFRWKPRLHLSDTEPPRPRDPKLPEGFITLDDAAECNFAEGVLEAGPNGLRLSLAPEQVSIQTPVRHARQVGFRDDFSCFVLPRLAAAGWAPGDSLVIDMPQDRFPPALQLRYAEGPRVAQVTVTAQGVFVTPGALLPQPEVAAERPVRRRRLFSPVRSALIGMVCLGLAAGAALRDDEPFALPALSFLPMHFGADQTAEPASTRLAAR